MTEIHTLTAAEIGRRIDDGRLDPREVADAFLDRIASHSDGADIYARATPDRARAEADAAAARARDGVRRGPLDGVPLSWKDLFDTAGTATEAGSALMSNRVPQADAEVLRRATLGGSVCLGKTHMTELAFAGIGYNPITATPPNVHDRERVPGGSSSGAAASVAHGLAPAGIGSDTGGSVRVPAAWNGLVGLKTSSGRLPLDGVVPLAPFFDTVGPLTRTVEDAALVFALLAGETEPDLAGADLTGKRFMVLETSAFDDIRDAPADAFEDAVRRLETAGAHIERGAVAAVAEAMPLSAQLFAPEGYAHHGARIEANPDAMYEEVRERFRLGRDVTAADYLGARIALDGLRAEYLAATAGYDAVLVPTAPILPPKLDRLKTDGAYYREQNLMTLRNTRIGNLMGLAVLQLPTGTPMCGISLMTPPGTERGLLRLGMAAEAALG
ncbi:amidase [Roseobacter sp. HKCCA0434]|uniref:amidase n=1 Tax=Roseobacter sp. HKCCA0434 TaxID=3079297 RepID=UPI00290595D1|nr:amidase family protein [Roseobacter sp. HKCCA0434]